MEAHEKVPDVAPGSQVADHLTITFLNDGEKRLHF